MIPEAVAPHRVRERPPLARFALSQAALLALCCALTVSHGAIAQPAARSSVTGAARLSAPEIMRRAWDHPEASSLTARMELRLVDSNGERVRRLLVFRRRAGTQRDTLLRFTAPADLAGTALLIRDFSAGSRPGRENEQWLYVPALKQVRRLAAADLAAPLMDSDFTLADLATPPLEDLRFELLGEETLAGAPCWRIGAVAASPSVAQRLGYARSELWVRQQDYGIAQELRTLTPPLESGPALQRRLTVLRAERYSGYWVPTEVDIATLRGAETLHRTLLKLTGLKINPEIEERVFDEKELGRGW